VSLALAALAATVASVTSVLWLRKRRHAAWVADMQDWLDDARRGFDDPVAVRRLAPGEEEWSAALDEAMTELATLATDAAQLADLVAIVDDVPYMALRSFVRADRRTIVFVSCSDREAPIVGLASYTEDARYLTVRMEGMWGARSAISRVLRLGEDTPVSDMLRQHAAHTAGQRLLEVTTTDDYIAQLERMERLESDWRDRQAPADLMERDLKTALGEDRYIRLAGTIRNVPPRVPHAHVRRGRSRERP
jgi:hypothetical protein